MSIGFDVGELLAEIADLRAQLAEADDLRARLVSAMVSEAGGMVSALDRIMALERVVRAAEVWHESFKPDAQHIDCVRATKLLRDEVVAWRESRHARS